MNTSLRYEQLDIFNSDTLTSANRERVHVVFQLHIDHSLSCVPLQQYRACVIEGWELRVSYITVICVQGIPILSPYIPHSNLKNSLHVVVSIASVHSLGVLGCYKDRFMA